MFSKTEFRNPWFFVPTAYFAEGLPYVLINSVSVILYKNMGVSNADIAFWTSWLYLPWVVKMLWGPMVDTYGTRRGWLVHTQLIMACCLVAATLSMTGARFFAVSLLAFAAAAFVSATHDIAADGFYMLALNGKEQAFFVGVRTMFYRFAMLFGTGFLVYRAGRLQKMSGDIPGSWGIMLLFSGLIFLILFLYHRFVLPYPTEDVPKAQAGALSILRSVATLGVYLAAAGLLAWLFNTLTGFWQKLGTATALTAVLVFVCKKYLFPCLKRKLQAGTDSFNEAFISYFTMDGIGYIIAFILFYRFAEAMLLKLAPPFLLDAVEKGGLGISTSEVGLMYGTFGMGALIAGGLLGGWLISRYGFRKCLWPMVFALHVPDVFYLYMACARPSGWLTCVLVSAEQFGYGIGLTAFTVYLMMICRGKYKTAHFAISTGIMALGMMLPGMISGKLQEALGYRDFFLAVCALTIPGMLVILRLPINPDSSVEESEIPNSKS